MPIYEFHCPKCDVVDEIISSHTDTLTHSCGTEMRRKFSIPLVLMKQSANQMALDTLNSKESSHMKHEQKLEAAKGLARPPKTIF